MCQAGFNVVPRRGGTIAIRAQGLFQVSVALSIAVAYSGRYLSDRLSNTKPYLQLIDMALRGVVLYTRELQPTRQLSFPVGYIEYDLLISHWVHATTLHTSTSLGIFDQFDLYRCGRNSAATP